MDGWMDGWMEGCKKMEEKKVSGKERQLCVHGPWAADGGGGGGTKIEATA
jgi:hypothetical protein